MAIFRAINGEWKFSFVRLISDVNLPAMSQEVFGALPCFLNFGIEPFDSLDANRLKEVAGQAQQFAGHFHNHGGKFAVRRCRLANVGEPAVLIFSFPSDVG
ncbi:hypothetical protein AB5I41_19055 [Sphingomonas sp. MMS24-JH45]